jgi:hypothetical protein
MKYNNLFERLRAIYFVSKWDIWISITQVIGKIYIYILAIRIALVINCYVNGDHL